MPDSVRRAALVTRYATLFSSLLPGISGTGVYDSALEAYGHCGSCAVSDPGPWLRSVFGAPGEAQQRPAICAGAAGTTLIGLPLLRTRGRLLAVACVEVSDECVRTLGAKPAQAVAERLQPALACLHRELAAEQANQSRLESMGERTAELEWLFNVSTELERAPDDARIVRQLLAAATARLRSAVGALIIPDRHLSLQHALTDKSAALLEVLAQTRTQLVNWAQRQAKPLVLNAAARPGSPFRNCKLLCVPVAGHTGRVAGVLVFLNPLEAEDFRSRQLFLAKHLSRQLGRLAEAEFDLMTGLFTRPALEQRVEESMQAGPDTVRSVVLVDIDRLHVVNEVHGFELGDELIVRIADILGSAIVPAGALVSRLSGDRFAIVLENQDPRQAANFATEMLQAASRIVIGPDSEPIEVSVSCGIAALVSMPKGLARALAAADIACKAAKDRGRNRVELYACEDSSMMRRRDDVVVVGRLRDAIRHERLLLYAQPIVKLEHEHPLSGFELLIRMSNEDGSVSAPSDFMSAAQRYQLMPAIDRYALKRALQAMAPYRGLLRELMISISVNVSAQTLADPTFVDYFIAEVRKGQLAPGMFTCEITEQTAVTSLAKAAEMMTKLRKTGCRVALDDFGTGANTLASLKGLPIDRLKIDGSFIRDLATSRRSEAMVKTIVGLAAQFGVDTVAEFVESAELADRLRRLGVKHGQGYHFGKPQPFETALQGLKDDESKRLRALWLET